MYAYRSHARLKQTALVAPAVTCTIAPVSRSSLLKAAWLAVAVPAKGKEDDMIIRERLAKERARLQAAAEQNRQLIAQAKRERA